MKLNIEHEFVIQMDELMDVNGSWTNTSGQFSAFLDTKNKLWYDDEDCEKPENVKEIRLLQDYSNPETSDYDFVLITLEDESEFLYRLRQGEFPRK